MENIRIYSLDIGYDGFALETRGFFTLLTEICDEYNLEIVGFKPFGPAGGNPEITFRGKSEDLIRLSTNFYEDADEGLDMFNQFSEEDHIKTPLIKLDKSASERVKERKFVKNGGEFMEY
jgi:hypothetical protein